MIPLRHAYAPLRPSAVELVQQCVTEAAKKAPKGDAPLSADDKKFIKDNTTKEDKKKKSGGGGGGDFNAKHPRAEAGSAAGGEFVVGSSGEGEEGKDEKGKGKKPGAGGPGLAFKAGYDKPGGDTRVKSLQAQLNKLGLTDDAGKKLAVDGKLGPKTTAAIKKAQKKLGMKPTGKADAAFLKEFADSRGKGSVKVAKTEFSFGKGKGDKSPAKKTKTPEKKPGAKTTLDAKIPVKKRPTKGATRGGN